MPEAIPFLHHQMHLFQMLHGASIMKIKDKYFHIKTISIKMRLAIYLLLPKLLIRRPIVTIHSMVSNF